MFAWSPDLSHIENVSNIMKRRTTNCSWSHVSSLIKHHFILLGFLLRRSFFSQLESTQTINLAYHQDNEFKVLVASLHSSLMIILSRLTLITRNNTETMTSFSSALATPRMGTLQSSNCPLKLIMILLKLLLNPWFSALQCYWTPACIAWHHPRLGSLGTKLLHRLL